MSVKHGQSRGWPVEHRGEVDEALTAPQQHGVDMLDDHEPITISVYPPSTGNTDDPRNSYLSAIPSPMNMNPDADRHRQNQESDLTFSSRGYLVEQETASMNGFPANINPGGDPSTSRRFVIHEDTRSIHNNVDGLYEKTWAGWQNSNASTAPPPRWPEFPDPPLRETFTTINPFARKKHRLSWSNILSVKHGKKLQEKPASAWSPPASYPMPGNEHNFEDDLEDQATTGYLMERSWTSVETANSQLRQPSHRIRRPLSLPLGLPSFLPVMETTPATGQSNSPRHSIISGSSSASYHSFAEEKVRGTKVFDEAAPDTFAPHSRLHAATHENNAPELTPQRFDQQTTKTTLDDSIIAPCPSPDETQDTSIVDYIGKYIPKRTYLYILLGLPGLYFTRVSNLFEDASMSMETMTTAVFRNASVRQYPEHDNPAFEQLNTSWLGFIDTLMREWKTLNLISVLLLSAIVAILQIEKAFLDPVVHYSALISLVCALVSLLFGCMYILRFNTMRMPHKALQWAQETQNANANVFWNVWIMLAIPAVWLVWSIIFYIACIMAFVWRIDANSNAPPPIFGEEFVLAIRIGISIALAVGIIYIIVVLRVFMDFGAPMDRRFAQQVKQLAARNRSNHPSSRPMETTHPVRAYPASIAPSNASLRSRTSRFSANLAQPVNLAPSDHADGPAHLRDTHVRFNEYDDSREDIPALNQPTPFYPKLNFITPDPDKPQGQGSELLSSLPAEPVPALRTVPPDLRISMRRATQALPARKRVTPIPPGLPVEVLFPPQPHATATSSGKEVPTISAGDRDGSLLKPISDLTTPLPEPRSRVHLASPKGMMEGNLSTEQASPTV